MTLTTDSGFKPSTAKPSGGESPLRDVLWNMSRWEAVKNTFNNPDGSSTERTTLKFYMQIKQVYASEEPFPWPNTIIEIPYTDPARAFNDKNRWGAFSASLRKLFGTEDVDLDMLVGKDQRWTQSAWTMGRKLADGEEAPLGEDGVTPLKVSKSGYVDDPHALAWQVQEVQGVALAASAPGQNGLDTLSMIADLADGKVEADFYSACVAQAWFREDETLVTAATDRKIVDMLITAGKITRGTDGIFHKV